jgi:tetratricopeptide (TPR) repeat protein
MSRRVRLPVAALALAVVLVGAIVTVRILRPRPPAAAPSAPHARVAGFEPSAANVSAELTTRLRTLRNRVAAAPADTSALLELARLLHDAHQPGEAVPYYRRYLEVNPANREAWFDLADSEGRAGDWLQARATMQTLLDRTPDDPAIQYDMGVIELQIGNADAGRGWLEKAAAQTTDSAVANRARATLAQMEKRP